jgi:hypothetical protein
MEANKTSPWSLIVVSLVSIGMTVLSLIAASLDKPVMPLGTAESGAVETLRSLVSRWYC